MNKTDEVLIWFPSWIDMFLSSFIYRCEHVMFVFLKILKSPYFDTIPSTSSFGGVSFFFFFECQNLFLIRDGHRDPEEHQQLHSASCWEQRDKMEVTFIKIPSQGKKSENLHVLALAHTRSFFILLRNCFTDYMYVASSVSKRSHLAPFGLLRKLEV